MMIDSRLPEDSPEPGVVVPSASVAGPADPGPAAIGVLRPLGLDEVRLGPDGLFGAWQERNAAATLPHCIEQLESSGNLDNVRRVTGTVDGAFKGMWFADSDIYKTLEAVLWELARNPSPGLRSFVDDTVALLVKAQDDDGYLNSYFQTDHRERQWQELRWSHELYCAGHLIQAAVAAARVGVGEQLVVVARRFADLLVERFSYGGVDAVCGHPEIETALVELYRVTGHAPYLELACRFVDLRGRGLLGDDRMGRQYYQDHTPIREASQVTGHAVRQLYLLAGAVDAAVETNDVTLLSATRRLWESAFQTKTYLTGAHGSRHRDEAFGDPYELPPDRAYAETCAAIASFQWNWRMLLATGASRYADEMERVLYNGIAGSTALDGAHFFYSNPLQLRTGHDGSHEDAPSRRLPWYSCSCCPPNLARLMASLQAYVATTSAPTGPGSPGLQIHLYAESTIRVEIDDAPVSVTIHSGYPWNGHVSVAVRSSSVDPWTLMLRVPDWCEDYWITVDGVSVAATAQDGYIRLYREWSDATVSLELSMPPRLVEAHPHVDAVRGCGALMRGPLVYCLEQADLPASALLEDVVLHLPLPPTVSHVDAHGAGLPDGTVVLAARGEVRRAASDALYQHTPYADTPEQISSVPLTAVPYFLWGNRAPGAMRVWIPLAPEDVP